MNDLLFSIIKLLVIILITLVVRYGVPFLKQKLEDAKLSGEQTVEGDLLALLRQKVKTQRARFQKDHSGAFVSVVDGGALLKGDLVGGV